MKVKLSDVAKAAGVSVSTVSRVINGDRERPASQETADNIWKIVKDLGYIPNKNAKKLVKGEYDEEIVGRIGCVYTTKNELNNDPFFSCIGLGIQKELSCQNYSLSYALYVGNMDYKELYSYTLKHPVDGVIILGQLDKSLLEILKKQCKFLVYAGVNTLGEDLDEVVCDGYDGARLAISHLINMKHSDIGYAGYVPELMDKREESYERRYQAYCDYMNELDSRVNRDNIIPCKLQTTDAYNQAIGYLERLGSKHLPTAFFCANDAIAFGVMKALRDYGIDVPGDVAIIGLDNVEMASFVTPTLSTISIPKRAIGARAVKLLVEQIEVGRDYCMKINLPCELKVRESSNHINNKNRGN